jgi:hypothetical protein
MERAAAYQYRNDLFVHASGKLTSGVGVLIQPVIRVSHMPDEELGKTVLSVLNSYRTNVAEDDVLAVKRQPMHVLAGVKNWKEFEHLARCVTIEREGDILSFTPSRHVSDREGYVDLLEKVETCRTEPTAVGRALHLAFARCE